MAKPFLKDYGKKKAGAKGIKNTPGYARRVARTLLDVLVDTGRINYTEMRARMYPNANRNTNRLEGHKMITPEVREEFFKLLILEEKVVDSLSCKDVVRDILTDLHRIDLMLNDPEIDSDAMAKLSTTKTAKQKLLGQYLGIWKEDKKAPEQESDPDELFNRFHKRLAISLN